MNLVKVALYLDIFRIVPRLILSGYAYLVFFVVDWFTRIQDPSTQQAALISTVIGASAAVVGLYTNSGQKWELSDLKQAMKEATREAIEEVDALKQDKDK